MRVELVPNNIWNCYLERLFFVNVTQCTTFSARSLNFYHFVLKINWMVIKKRVTVQTYHHYRSIFVITVLYTYNVWICHKYFTIIYAYNHHTPRRAYYIFIPPCVASFLDDDEASCGQSSPHTYFISHYNDDDDMSILYDA